jgi:diguanylate cyclase
MLRAQDVDPEELRELYNQHFRTRQASDELVHLGDQLAALTGEIEKSVEFGRVSTAKYQQELTGARANLEVGQNSQTLRPTIEGLISATRAVEQENEQLRGHLTVSMEDIRTLQLNLDSARMESRTDELTRIPNRKHFDELLDAEMARSKNQGPPLSLLMLDVDHFKAFNDTHGHTTGDQILQLLGSVLKQTVRGQDLPARYGGEEFAIILPATTLDQALCVAENIRSKISKKELVRRSTGKFLGKLTVSIGAAEYVRGESKERFVQRADSALYRAKREGRNRTATLGPEFEGCKHPAA